MKSSITSFTAHCLGVALALALLVGAASAQDINKIWTSVGSTGTVDEADTDKLNFSGALVVMKGATPGTKAVVRYNVVAVDGLFANLTPTSWPALIVRYNTLNGRGRVVARLKEYIMNGPQEGQTNTLITFDSDDYPQDGNYQTRAIGNCGNFGHFVFASPQIARSYFIEVELTTHSPFVGPGLGALAISRYGVCSNNVFLQP